MISLKFDSSLDTWIAFIDKSKSPTQKWQENWVEAARDRVHNLDLSLQEHQLIYRSTLKTHIMFNELTWNLESIKGDDGKFFQIPQSPKINLSVYKDSQGLRTIGMGFNMDEDSARNEWDGVLGKEISFDAARNGKISLTQEQAYKLFNYSLSIREKKLAERYFKKEWPFLKPNEKITITSLYYNGGEGLLGQKFCYNIKEYTKTGNPEYLKQAFSQVKYYSNKHKYKGVQIRMDRESLMLESYKCPLYSKPHDKPIPNNASINAQIGITVIPHIGQTNENDTDGNNKKYYIWRTQNDSKVRPKHQFYEGKLFSVENPPSIGHPGEDYNCRCIKDFNIPEFVTIETLSEQKMIRKYITNLFEIKGFCIK